MKFTLTQQQTDFKRVLQNAKTEIRKIEAKYQAVRNICIHVVNPEFTDKYQCDVAYCEVCNKTFGWKCPESPDHVCYYYTDGLKNCVSVVELIDKTIHPLENHTFNDVQGETEDCCLFCGQPQERK